MQSPLSLRRWSWKMSSCWTTPSTNNTRSPPNSPKSNNPRLSSTSSETSSLRTKTTTSTSANKATKNWSKRYQTTCSSKTPSTPSAKPSKNYSTRTTSQSPPWNCCQSIFRMTSTISSAISSRRSVRLKKKTTWPSSWLRPGTSLRRLIAFYSNFWQSRRRSLRRCGRSSRRRTTWSPRSWMRRPSKRTQ